MTHRKLSVFAAAKLDQENLLEGVQWGPSAVGQAFSFHTWDQRSQSSACRGVSSVGMNQGHGL